MRSTEPRTRRSVAKSEAANGAGGWSPAALAVWPAILCGGLLLAALAAPLVYRATQVLLPQVDWSVGKVFNRTAMAAAIALLVALRRRLPWRQLGESLRGDGWRAAGKALALGLAVGLVSVTVGAACGFALDELEWRAGFEFDLTDRRTVSGAAGALVASLAEESFFRVLVLASLLPTVGPLGASLASAAFYSGVHLLSSHRAISVDPEPLSSGFAYLFAVLRANATAEAWPVLFGLLLAGLVLSLAMLRHRSLYLCVGIHAAWMCAFKSFLQHATAPVGLPELVSRFAQRNYLVGQPWAWISFAVAVALLLALPRRPR